MIEYTKGNLLEADVEAIVNTVNCVGVMGKGIALQFKQAFPDNFKTYAKACKTKEVQLGSMFIYTTDSILNPKFIVNFPTKGHWRGKSKIDDVRTGLTNLVNWIEKENIKSIAIPPLGAGLGGLDWLEVKSEIEKAFSQLTSKMDTKIFIYEPIGSPNAKSMPVNTTKPRMTLGRALLIKLLDIYDEQGYQHSLLEVQKLAYFLQEAGEPLKLNYIAYHYGPYAENLNFVLQRIEGHFIRGYGDRSAQAEIELFASAVSQAEEFLADKSDSKQRLEQVEQLIEGFETPYGMELLATVHWVVKQDSTLKQNIEKIVETIAHWNSRKKKLMKPAHIKTAYHRLEVNDWV